LSELSVRGLTVSAGTVNRQSRLENLTVQLPAGGITLVVGRTGAGKSTLLHVLAGLEAPQHGNVYYDNQPLWEKKKPNVELLRQIGVVFQDPEHQLFARTGQKEFDYSLRPYRLGVTDRQRRVQEALQAVDLPTDVLREFPLTLSGGQQRRLSIATTLATRPNWLLLDEPTAGLDAKSAQALLAFLLDYLTPADRSAIIATHDLEAFLPIAKSIVFLRQGQVLAHYSVAEALRNPEVFEEAEVGYPSSLELRIALQAHGFPLPLDTGISAEEMASAIAFALRVRHESLDSGLDSGSDIGSAGSSSASCLATATGPYSGLSDAVAEPPLSPEFQPGLQPDCQPTATATDRSNFDVRAKWVFYVLVSMGVFSQTHWLGLLTATSATILLTLASKLDYRNLLRTVRPVLYLMGLSVGLAGVHWNGNPSGTWAAGLGFSLAQAIPTFWQTWKFWLLLVLGVWFSTSSSQLEMRKGIEQVFGGLAKLRFPVAAFALAITLFLRFLPVLSTEQAKFATITRARGKSRAHSGRLRLRDLPAFTVPMLLSLFRLGENLALAMEARGCSGLPSPHGKHTSPPAHFSRKDWGLVMTGIVLLILFLGMAKY